MPTRTHDRVSTLDVLTVDQIGPKRSLTPEGFLLCRDVPIARSGWLLYGPNEVPVGTGRDGYAKVHRTKDELFKDTTVSSFVGKPVVNDHPDEDVTPHNWKKYSVGTILSVRPEEPEPDVGVLLADVLITDEQAIKDIDANKREVSAGYDADYEDNEDGTGVQTDIIGNHLALVNRGRCGPRCSIGDQAPQEKHDMPTQAPRGKHRVRLVTAVRKAFRDAEQAAVDELESSTAYGSGEEGEQADDLAYTDTGDDNHTHIHVHMPGGDAGGGGAPSQDTFTQDDPTMPSGDMGGGDDDPVEARFQSLEQGHAELKQMLAQIMQQLGGGGTAPPDDDAGGDEPPPSTKDSADEMDPDDDTRTKTNDSAALATSWQTLMSEAEILVPGIRVPTFDASAGRKRTVDAMCQFRGKVLSALDGTSAGQTLLSSVGGAYDLASMSCAAKAGLFQAAVGAKRLLNNRQSTADHSATQKTAVPLEQRNSPAALEALFNSLYSDAARG